MFYSIQQINAYKIVTVVNSLIKCIIYDENGLCDMLCILDYFPVEHLKSDNIEQFTKLESNIIFTFLGIYLFY